MSGRTVIDAPMRALRRQLPVALLASLEIQEDQAVARLVEEMRSANVLPAAATANAEDLRARLIRPRLWANHVTIEVPGRVRHGRCRVALAITDVGTPAPATNAGSWVPVDSQILRPRLEVRNLPGPGVLHVRAQREVPHAPWYVFGGALLEGKALHFKATREVSDAPGGSR